MSEDQKKIKKIADVLFIAILVQIFFMGLFGYLLYDLNKKINITNTLLKQTNFNRQFDAKDLLIKSNNNDIILGDLEAPMEIFLYTDYHCKFCQQFFDSQPAAVAATQKNNCALKSSAQHVANHQCRTVMLN